MLENILQWHILIFYVSIMLGIVFILSSISGIGAGTDIDADIADNPEIEFEGHESFFIKFLSLFGVGRCPLSIVLFTAFLLFGASGLFLNIFFPPLLRVFSVLGALLITSVSTRFIALAVSAFMPQTETYNITPEHFVGKRGKVVISVSETFGQIHVLDNYGSLHKLNARTYSGRFAISDGVLITEYKDGVFYVDKPKEELR